MKMARTKQTARRSTGPPVPAAVGYVAVGPTAPVDSEGGGTSVAVGPTAPVESEGGGASVAVGKRKGDGEGPTAPPMKKNGKGYI